MFKARKSPQNTSNVTENEFTIVAVTTDDLTVSLTNSFMKKVEKIFHELLSAVTPGKNVQYFTGLLYFSKFDKCDVKSHLH